MPRVDNLSPDGKGKKTDYYEIAVRQLTQQILPPTDHFGVPTGYGETPVWSYCSALAPLPFAQGGTLYYPVFTIEARYNRPTRVKWINQLVDADGNYLPHLLPVDQTLHWANPPGGMMHRDHEGHDGSPYTGPVPTVIHVHGAHVAEHSDGYPEAWHLPAAENIPPGSPRPGPSTICSRRIPHARARSRDCGARATRCSSTRTISAPRRCGITITPLA
jgi:hypothetical protein